MLWKRFNPGNQKMMFPKPGKPEKQKRKPMRPNQKKSDPRKFERDNLIKVMDAIIRAKVLQRDNGTCLRCNDRYLVQHHHFITRTFLAVRWEIDNGVTVCPECHDFLQHNEIENINFAIKQIGKARWDELISHKHDYFNKSIENLKMKIEEL